jgi:hypothetical protein
VPLIVPPELPWTAEAEAPGAIVQVLPPCLATDDLSVDVRGSLTGTVVDARRELTREARTREAARVPEAIGWSLPGEIAAAGVFDGRFAVGEHRARACRRLDLALRSEGPIEPALAAFAGAEPVLVVWVDEIVAEPFSVGVLPGEVVHTPVGPVVVDLFAEPYRVTASVGAALVSEDGAVVVRVADRFETVLADDRNAAIAGRALARELSLDIARIWPSAAVVAQR